MSGDILRQLGRRVSMMLGIGRITAHSDAGGIQKLQYQTPLEVRGGTPRMAEFGFSSGLPVGTDVVIAYLGGGSLQRCDSGQQQPAIPAIWFKARRIGHL